MEHIVTNLAGRASRVTRHGREYLTVPATSIVPGVLPGSQGPLYYPADELAKAPDAWNGVPVVVRHPVVNGQNVSARDPDVLDDSEVGRVFRTRYQGKLTHEFRLDVESLKRVSPTTLAAIEAGKAVEISTGLYTTNEPAPDGSEFGGRPYTHTARDYRPDHIAVLPDATGACSVRDGCGILVNEGQKMSLWQRLGELLGVRVPTAEATEAPTADPTANARPNEPSHSDLRKQLQALVEKRFGMGGMSDAGIMPACYVCDVYDKTAVYEWQGKTYEIGYTSDLRTGAVALSDEPPVEVRKITSYKPVTNAGPDTDTTTEGEESDMDRKAVITWLVANCDCWKKEGDQAVLEKLPDDNLARLKDGAEKAKAAVTGNAVPGTFVAENGQVFTFDAQAGKWQGTPVPTVNALTPEQQEDIAFARAERIRQKSAMVSLLTANMQEPAKAAAAKVFMDMRPDQLQPLVAAMPVPVQQLAPAPNYWGQAPVPVLNAKDDSDNVLPMEEYDFSRPDKRTA